MIITAPLIKSYKGHGILPFIGNEEYCDYYSTPYHFFTKKESAHKGNILSFQSRHFIEGALAARKQTGSPKSSHRLSL